MGLKFEGNMRAVLIIILLQYVFWAAIIVWLIRIGCSVLRHYGVDV